MYRNFLVFYFNQNSETKDFPELENVKLTNYAITSYLVLRMIQLTYSKVSCWILEYPTYLLITTYIGLSPKETI